MSRLTELLGSNPSNERLELVIRLLQEEKELKRIELELAHQQQQQQQQQSQTGAACGLGHPQQLYPFEGDGVSLVNQGLETLNFSAGQPEQWASDPCGLPHVGAEDTTLAGWKALDSLLQPADNLDGGLAWPSFVSAGEFVDGESLATSPYSFAELSPFGAGGSLPTASADSLDSLLSDGASSFDPCADPANDVRMQTTSGTTNRKLASATHQSSSSMWRKRGVGAQSTKCRAKKVEIACRVCGESLGVAHLYAAADIANRHVQDYACKRCAQGTAWDDKKTQRQVMQKKRHAQFEPRDAPARCDICKNVCAAGGFRRTTDDDGGGKREAWIAASCAIELNCKACLNKYALCSDCGAGGKFRAGRWRPLEMFVEGRATCSLSHKRLGNVKSKVAVWHLWDENHSSSPATRLCIDDLPAPTWALIQATKQCVVEGTFKFLGCPQWMENNPEVNSWHMLNHTAHAWAERNQKELEGMMTPEDGPATRAGPHTLYDPGHLRSYIAMRVLDSDADAGRRWEDATPDNLHTMLPRICAYYGARWHVAKRLVMCRMFFGHVRELTMNVLMRVLDDHVAYTRKAAQTGLPCPPSPLFHQLGVGKFEKATNRLSAIGYRAVVRKGDEWEFKDTRPADDDERQFLKDIVVEEPEETVAVYMGRIEEVLRIWRASKADVVSPDAMDEEDVVELGKRTRSPRE
ncbi:uncharacterized protein EV422DRAFT_80681 [Fimicolochytrium jonesii]|uniref:uncharacterized protein n=1 Tax=Fimicolochytrium jonesii TaxID=1396493 RepID=UPI0022FE4786|nr:uncharacterized protein EV422DRAFT_80681 [Fimicolochytrium jonesii]KAI8820147.1 hypothetical protein EV422DRAFT_80681 [Fimicolochytrium jonesii]